MDNVGGLCEINGGHPRTLSVHEFFEFIKWHPRTLSVHEFFEFIKWHPRSCRL